MKKTKKALASLAIAGMVLSMAPAGVFAAEDTRLAGSDRYQTSIKIAEKAYASATTAVIAAGNPENLVDALAAAPLAAQKEAPIYLTDKKDMNNDVIKSLKKLGVKDVIVVGAAASQAVVDELKAAGFTVDSVKGNSRVETANAINAKLTAPKGTIVVGYNGVPDAMSVASYAAANNYAIVVADRDGSAGVSKADYVIGGPTLVKDIAGAERIFGTDRYETNKKVIAELDFEFGKVYVGNGATLADALVGSVLAAQTNSPIALTDGKTVKADIASNLKSDSVVVALGGTGVVSDAVIDAVKKPVSGEFKVESVSAVSANSFKVVFGKAAADISKVTFSVTRNTTPVTTTVTWNDAKTEATLTGASNFPEGTYAVAVKNDTTDLGSRTLDITQQKIAKINITSTKLAVSGSYDADPAKNTQKGYATYTVLDQYGNDIKSSYLANNLQFQTGVADSIVAKNGVLTITPNTNLIQFANVVITGYDSTTGVSTSATLATSTALGTLSDITLKALTNVDNKELTATDTTSMFYITYTATDISGNPTTDFNLVKNGLILTGDAKDELSVSSSYVKAKVVADPSDSSKAAIEVQVIDPTVIAMDLPVTITAMSYSGKTSTLNLTLKKQAEVDTFTLMAPAYDIAVNETKEIPFVAYDQNGEQVTKFIKLDQIVTLSGGLEFKQNVDGTAKLVVHANSVKGPQIVTAQTKTSKISTLTLNIQKAAEAATLEVDRSVLVSAMQSGAQQSVDFGYIGGNGGLTVKDQYGRKIDMVAKPGNYEVVAFSGGNVSATGIASGSKEISISAGNPGSGSVKFYLIDVTQVTDKTNEALVSSKALDSKTVTLSVVQNNDIKGYTIDTVKELYAASAVGATSASGRASDYSANPSVYGTTTSGAKVVLANNPIKSVTTTSPNFFATSAGAYDSVKVYATKYSDPAKTTASATLTVIVNGVDGKTYTVTTPITSTIAAPTASSMGVSVDTSVPGISVDGDTITVDLVANPNALQTGQYITRWKNDDGASVSRAKIYLFAQDQYGKKGMKLASISKLDGSTAANFTVDEYGKITVGAISDGQYADISAVSTNGLVKTIRIQFKTGTNALTKIGAYAADKVNKPAPTVADYAAAGVTGVTAANLTDVNAALATTDDTVAKIQAKVNSVNAVAPLAKIGAYAADKANKPVPTVADYAAAGVNGVTAANVDEVNAALANTDDTLAEIQAVVDSIVTSSQKAAALAKIGAYAADKVNKPVPTVADYAAAGVNGVTAANVDEVNAALTSTDDTLAEIQAVVDPINTAAAAKAAAIAKIKAYANLSTNPKPNENDYATAGVTGVTAANVDEVNAIIETYIGSQVDTTEKIQAILDANL